jgi:hypothetical protein
LDVDARLFRAALGFLQLPPRAPELRLLHRGLDTWTGVGLIAVGVERQGLRLSMSHIAENEWRARFMSSPMFAPEGFGVAPTPWRAVQGPCVGRRRGATW